jgi:hypothetical protein
MKQAIVVLIVLGLAATAMNAGSAQAGGSARGASVVQKWEYKVLGRYRTAEYTDAIRSGVNITDWIYQEDGKEIGKLDLVVKLRELGDAGWELVSTYPMSGYTGDFGGLTTNVVWTFKRPK